METEESVTGLFLLRPCLRLSLFGLVAFTLAGVEPLWAMRLVIKNQALNDLFYVDGFSARAEVVGLSQPHGEGDEVEEPLRCGGDHNGDYMVYSFWCLLQRMLLRKAIEPALILQQQDLFAEPLFLTSANITENGDKIRYKLELSTENGKHWLIRVILRKSTSLLSQLVLLGVDILFNGESFYVIVPEHDSVFIRAVCKLRPLLVSHDNCRAGKEVDPMTGQQPPPPPPPQPPGSGIRGGRAVSPLVYARILGYTTGQVEVISPF